MKVYYKYINFVLFGIIFFFSCKNSTNNTKDNNIQIPNILDYSANPRWPKDNSALSFSDQGAWFSYGFPTDNENYGGFSGPFLMTQENGVWSSKVLSQLNLFNKNTNKDIDWSNFSAKHKSYLSHLEQYFENKTLLISQKLLFVSANSALVITNITNKSKQEIVLRPKWEGCLFLKSLKLSNLGNSIKIKSSLSSAIGEIQVFDNEVRDISINDTSYSIILKDISVKSGEDAQLLLTQSFSFPDRNLVIKQNNLSKLLENPQKLIDSRIKEKTDILKNLYSKIDTNFSEFSDKIILSKALLTLQNNWRVSAEGIKHAGLFPSYHYVWFNGFWAWDSWKHASALALYDADLAESQVKAIYDFQQEDGFIPDCVYRDTSIEKNNYRNSKPPLSAWTVWNIFEQNADTNFIKEMYVKIKKQHNWWYKNRDYDKDGICEYGSTDGSLIAAKWESGMDNAVRFDNSEILKTSNNAYSLNQESVDLNSYLYAEKIYLSKMAKILHLNNDVKVFNNQAEELKTKIQNQFFDTTTSWFYDTSVDGKKFIKTMACEGWLPLWAKVASKEQAEAVKNTMMNPEYFNTKMPFQTLSALDKNFNPEKGYWRGPNWLDQSYFGVVGLKNYGYNREAIFSTYKLLNNAEGLNKKGKSIRENYNPITGNGENAQNFSWSAAHYLLLLINE